MYEHEGIFFHFDGFFDDIQNDPRFITELGEKKFGLFFAELFKYGLRPLQLVDRRQIFSVFKFLRYCAGR